MQVASLFWILVLLQQVIQEVKPNNLLMPFFFAFLHLISSDTFHTNHLHNIFCRLKNNVNYLVIRLSPDFLVLNLWLERWERSYIFFQYAIYNSIIAKCTNVFIIDNNTEQEYEALVYRFHTYLFVLLVIQP